MIECKSYFTQNSYWEKEGGLAYINLTGFWQPQLQSSLHYQNLPKKLYINARKSKKKEIATMGVPPKCSGISKLSTTFRKNRERQKPRLRKSTSICYGNWN